MVGDQDPTEAGATACTLEGQRKKSNAADQHDVIFPIKPNNNFQNKTNSTK
jgi:hypothetical protein